MKKHSVLTPPVIGKSAKILKVFRGIKKCSAKEGAILISGETGTGRELVAKAIHLNSPRKEGPFVAVNITALPARKCESELFGSGRTAIKAGGRGTGKILEANGGTIFIDEISQMDTSLQEKLCSIFRNDNAPDVRLMGGDTRHFSEKETEGELLKDLCEVFSTAHIHIPPLRERREDIMPLATFFLNHTAEKYKTGSKEIAKDTRTLLEKYDWPGNIDELELTMKRAVILSSDSVIRRKDILLDDIGVYSIKEFLEKKLRRYLKEMTKLGNCNLYETVLSEAEKALIEIVLKETKANQLKAARTLGINRNTLRAKIRGYKIKI
jgi:DNA-binding NtrC family response regulator